MGRRDPVARKPPRPWWRGVRQRRFRRRNARQERAVQQAVGLLAGLWVLAAAVATGTDRAERRWSFTTKTMGTTATVTLVGGDSLTAAGKAWSAARHFSRVDSLMSNWTRTSEVARINRRADSTSVVVHPEVGSVLAEALDVSRASDGAFDVTVEPLVRLWGFLGGPRRVPDSSEVAALMPRLGWRHVHFDRGSGRLEFDRPGMRIDLGGIAKGHAVDAAAAELRADGVVNALVDISGNMSALGAPAGAAGWTIGIRDPRDRIPYVARLPLSGECISTSGRYEQFATQGGRQDGHILDPRTGWSADGSIAVTVVAPTARTADAWSTALFAMAPDEARRSARAREDIRALLITPGIDRDTLWVEEPLLPRLTLEAKSAAFLVVRPF